MVLLRPPDVVEEAGQVGEEDQTPDTGAGKSASFLDEDQGADIDGHLPDVDETVAEAVPPFFREPDARPRRAARRRTVPGREPPPVPSPDRNGASRPQRRSSGTDRWPDGIPDPATLLPPFPQNDFDDKLDISRRFRSYRHISRFRGISGMIPPLLSLLLFRFRWNVFPLYSSGMPQRRFAAACFSFMFTPRAIMTRCACGEPAPCIDSVR